MKQPILFSVFCFSFLLTAVFAFREPSDITGSESALTQDSTDLLEAFRTLQETMPPPPTDFRPGHVAPRTIDQYLEKTKSGFIIQLPQGSLTPSPTIYQGLMLVSGGFGSKEFYAFDAQTGAVKWALDLDDDGPSSAVVEDDVAVFNTESCTVFACDALTGELLWSHYLGDPLMSTPSIAGGIVYTAYPAHGGGGGGYDQDLIQQQAPNIPNQTPNVYQVPQSYSTPNDTSVSAEGLRGTHVLIALELRTGKIRWQKWIDGDIMSAPVVEGEELYVTTFPGTFYKFESKTGEALAVRASRATSAPVVAGGEIYMSRRSDDGQKRVEEDLSRMSQDLNPTFLYRKAAPYLDQEVQKETALKQAAATYDAGNGFASGAPAVSGWQLASKNIGQSNVSSLQAFQGSRVLHFNGKNYATMGDELVCTDPESGEVTWRRSMKGDLYKEGGFLATPPLNVDGKIVIAELGGDIVFYQADTGKEWKRYATGGQLRFQPVLDEGRIYVSTVSGKVICIETGDKDLTGWPTWGANAAHTNKVGKQ